MTAAQRNAMATAALVAVSRSHVWIATIHAPMTCERCGITYVAFRASGREVRSTGCAFDPSPPRSSGR